MRKLVLFLLIAAFIGSGGYLAYNYFSDKKEEHEMEDLAKIVENAMKRSETVVSGGTEGEENGEAPIDYVRKEPEITVEVQDESESAEGLKIDQAEMDRLAGVVGEFIKDNKKLENKRIDAYKIEIVRRASGVVIPSDSGPVDEKDELSPNGTKADSGAAEGAKDAAENIVDGSSPEKNVTVLVRMGGSHPATQMDKATLDQLSQLVKKQVMENDAMEGNLTVTIILEKNSTRTSAILPQYKELYELNRDMVGWIKIDGTKLNYPVMQTPDDPEFYLRRDFAKKDAYSGVPFLDVRCSVEETSTNMIIYGHNMKSGSMFGTLPNYESRSYWQNHKIIHFDLLNETREYEVVGMFRAKEYKEGEEGFRYYQYVNIVTKDRFDSFVQQVKKHSFVDTGVTPKWGDELLTLSTCSYHVDDGVFVVVARRLMPEDEAGQ